LANDSDRRIDKGSYAMPWEPIAEVAAKLGLEAVKKFFEGKKDDKDLISVGLAVGYFYNFLNVISDVIKRNQVTQKSEIIAFRETLRQLQKRGYGTLVNILDFREIE
jgi:hypothetical protein